MNIHSPKHQKPTVVVFTGEMRTPMQKTFRKIGCRFLIPAGDKRGIDSKSTIVTLKEETRICSAKAEAV